MQRRGEEKTRLLGAKEAKRSEELILDKLGQWKRCRGGETTNAKTSEDAAIEGLNIYVKLQLYSTLDAEEIGQ